MGDQHTPGPWRWEISFNSKRIQLCGGKLPFDLTIMDFRRWGMQSATPRFLKPDKTYGELLDPAYEYAEIVPGREHHKEWFQTVNHPDARLIAAAPDLLAAARIAASSLLSTEPGYKELMEAINKATL